MSQNFFQQGAPAETGLVREYVANTQTNTDTLRSNFSGSTFPSTPVVGQHCFRVDEGIEYVFDGKDWIEAPQASNFATELLNARGSMNSLMDRLNVAINDDGTLKNPIAAEIDEWKDTAIGVTYVSDNQFSVNGDLTPIFTQGRAVKVYNKISGEITVGGFTNVVSSAVSDETTIVTVSDSIITSDLYDVKYGLLQESLFLLGYLGAFNTKQTFTSSGTFVAPVSGTYRITLQGGGGGGHGGYITSTDTGAVSGGGGGQGGHYEFYEKLTAGTTYTFIIGAGGTGGAINDGEAAPSGGASSITIGSNAYVANGGGGGFNLGNGMPGGAGGTVTINGVVVAKGAAGAGGGGISRTSTKVFATSPGTGGGAGGGSSLSNGGSPGLFGGGGGGGGINWGTATAGGAGGDGYITFEYCNV